jgi:TolA-binding protein
MRYEGKFMTTESSENLREAPTSAIHGSYHQYERLPDMWVRPSLIAVDKTIAIILGGIASAALAGALAGGTALIGKVEDTSQQLEKGRTERTQQFGDITKIISIVETKVNQLGVQIDQMETRLEKTIQQDLQSRDRRIDENTEEISRLREKIMDKAYAVASGLISML